MGCCGDKRQNWLAEKKVIKDQHNRLRANPDKKNIADSVIFEYTGEIPYSIRGSVTGRLYLFKKGDKLEVSYEDSFAFLGERYLVRK